MARQGAPEDLVIKKIRDIAQTSGIGDDGDLKLGFTRRVGIDALAADQGMNVVDMMRSTISANRTERMKPFMPFFRNLMQNVNFQKSMWSEARKVASAPDGGILTIPIREAAASDQRFTDYGDAPIDAAMRATLQDERSSRLWMGEIDRFTAQKSTQLLAEIDRRKKEGLPRYKIPRLVVGDGPLTASALVQLGSMERMGLVTEQPKLGAKWRQRGFFYINSASLENNPLDPCLPLLETGTTRVSPKSHDNALRARDMLPVSTLKVNRRLFQSDGSLLTRVRQYISGLSLGKLDAHNEVLNAEEFLMGQKVLFDRISQTEDGKSNIVVIQDVITGVQREIEIGVLDVFTGPGEETLRNVDSETQELYAKTLEDVDALVERVTEMKARGETIRPRMITDALPKLLTLTIMEKFYGLWDDVLEADDRYWPFRNLVRGENTVAFVGGGDTTRVIAEFCNQSGPREGYPDDLSRGDIPDAVLYNESARNKDEYDDKTRARYEATWGRYTSAKNVKINGVRLSPGGDRVRVLEKSSEVADYDYVVLSLGFEREDLVAKFADAGIRIEKLKDSSDNTIGLGNKSRRITINGSATGFGKEDFPESISSIIDILGIGENTVALWVYNLLSTRALWETGTVSKEKISRLIQEYVKTGKVDNFRLLFRNALAGESMGDNSLPVNELPVSGRIAQMASDLADSISSINK